MAERSTIPSIGKKATTDPMSTYGELLRLKARLMGLRRTDPDLFSKAEVQFSNLSEMQIRIIDLFVRRNSNADVLTHLGIPIPNARMEISNLLFGLKLQTDKEIAYWFVQNFPFYVERADFERLNPIYGTVLLPDYLRLVFDRVIMGRSDRDIRSDIKIGINAIEEHIKRIMIITGIPDREQLILFGKANLDPLLRKIP